MTYEEFLAQLPAYSEYINEETSVLVIIQQHDGTRYFARVSSVELNYGHVVIRAAAN